MAETAYIVLRRTRVAITRDNAAPSNVNEQWEHVAKVLASSAEGAIRKAAERANDSALPTPVLVAIPARSWKPLTVTAEQTTVLKLSSPASVPADSS